MNWYGLGMLWGGEREEEKTVRRLTTIGTSAGTRLLDSSL